jgi:putative nucleotidyltransferase with HDIG domain
LLEGLGARLRKRGVDHISFLRGVTKQELAHWLDALLEDGPLDKSKHIRIGHLSADKKSSAGGGGGGGSADPGIDDIPAPELLVGPHPRQQAVAVQRVWRTLKKEQLPPSDVLSSIVAHICAAVTESGGSLLHLATLKRHDEYTFVHTINVAILAAALGEATGVGADELHDLTIAALLHDIGKTTIPQSLLGKTSGLTEAEKRTMQRHPLEGARLLLNAKDLPEMAAIVAYEHHIRLGGGGYPKLPSGGRITLASQIVQVADIFDALRTNRPYRDAYSLEKSEEIMFEDAGSAFDADLLKLFFGRVARGTDRDGVRRAA